MMDRRAFFALSAAFAGVSVVPGVRAQAGGTGPAGAWRLATGYRADSFHGRNLQQLAQDLAQQGGPTIELHAQGKLAPLAEIPRAVREGRAEMGEAIMSGMAAQWPVAGADSLPFMVRHYDDARWLWQVQRPLVEEALKPDGLRVLMAVPWPPQGLYSRKPIARAADLQGQRMRTYNRTTERLAQLVGATPVDVPMVKVGEAFAAGQIDCMITSAATGVENEVWRHVRHYYDINAWFPKNLTFVAEAAWLRLDAAAQARLREASARAEERGWAESARVAAASVQALREAGMTVEGPGATLLNDIKRLGERFSLEWVREVGAPANRLLIPYYARSAPRS